MKQRLALIASVTLTVSILVSLQGVDLVSANYLPPPSIEISSPTSIKVYTEPSVQLYFRVNALTDKSSDIVYVRYCLDGKANVTLTDLSREDGLSYWAFKEGGTATGNGFTVNTTMTNLSEGKHTVVVYSHAADGTEMSRTIEFTVDYDYVSPQNPFGLPSFPNGTATLPPTITQRPEVSQTETPQPTVNIGPESNTGNLQPLENNLIIGLTCAVALVLVAGIIFRKKSKTFRDK